MEIRKVCVVGGGAMGRQIALNTALHGFETALTDVNGAVLAEGKAFNDRWLSERVAKGKLAEAAAAEGARLLRYQPDVEEAAKGCDLVVEAIVEDLGIKQKMFERLDRAAPPHAILATNSSTIVSSKLAGATRRPSLVVNLHYFNPALVMELVEVVQGPHTSPETAQALVEFCRRTGKTPILLRKEIYGFVANRLLHAIRREALHLLEQGVASVEEIDLAAEKALKHPMGPFRLQDFTGLDISHGASMSRFRESGDPADRPHPLIEEKVKKGELGRKTGKGWYTYPEGKPR